MKTWILVLLFFVPTVCSSGDDDKHLVGAMRALSDPGKSEQDVKHSVKFVGEFLKRFVTRLNRDGCKFADREEVRSARPKKLFGVYMVRLDELRQYRKDVDPNQILKPLDKSIVPIVVGDEVRCQVVITGKNVKDLRVTSFGSPRFAKLLTGYRQVIAAAEKLEDENFFAVDVPGLGAQFIGYQVGGEWWLVSLTDQPERMLAIGQKGKARDMFEVLVKPADEAYNADAPG